MGNVHRVVKSLIGLLIIVFIGLVGLLDYEMLLLLGQQSRVEALVQVAFSRMDEVLGHMKEQTLQLSGLEGGVLDVKQRVAGLSDRHERLADTQESLVRRFSSLAARMELAFDSVETAKLDYSELLEAYQDSQQALVELQSEHTHLQSMIKDWGPVAPPDLDTQRSQAYTRPSSYSATPAVSGERLSL